MNGDVCRDSRALARKPPVYFFPLFLMPWLPVFRGPFFPFADEAISLRAFSSRSACQYSSVRGRRYGAFGYRGGSVPALFFSWYARSSSSRSFTAFFAALRGLALPPGCASDVSESRGASGEDGSAAYHHVLDHPFLLIFVG